MNRIMSFENVLKFTRWLYSDAMLTPTSNSKDRAPGQDYIDYMHRSERCFLLH